MKLALAFMALTSALVSLAPDHAEAAGGRTITTHSYARRCRFEAPLDTYSGCNENSYAGARAAECAVDEATAACNEAYNTDCVVQGIHYASIISREFVGYKACEATVTVHGYQVGN